MFNPTKDEVRQFFCTTWKKSANGEVLTPLEAIALDWMRLHPEYENDLTDAERALGKDYSVDQGRSNPFLHLSMHLSLHEQVSVDQPSGIRDACQSLSARLGSVHDAHHQIMECLGEMLWTAQRNGTPPDGEAYIRCVRQRAGE